MTPEDPRKSYSLRILEIESHLKRIRKIELLLSILKLFIAAAGVFILFKIATTNKNVYLLLLGGTAILFGIPAVVHEYFIRRRRFYSTLKTINRMEISALDNEFPDYDDGGRFVDEDHPYTTDLDIFGPRSVYHFINRTTTLFGSQTLARWLASKKNVAETDQIRTRQDSIRELKQKIDLRQNVQTHGKLIEMTALNTEAIPRLLDERGKLPNSPAFTLVLHLLPVLTLGAAVSTFAGLHWGFPLALIVFQLSINRRYRESVGQVYSLITRNAMVLKSFSRIIEELEAARFESLGLKELQEKYFVGDLPASRNIRRLALYASCLEIRKSEILHPLLNSLFLWDLHFIEKIERWRNKYEVYAKDWFQAIGEYEGLSSLANLAFNNPEWTFPELNPDDFSFVSKSLGHFLIPSDERVNNDVELRGRGHIQIVTGPNMAGKSTLLKTIGINLVLALTGSSVCASQMSLSRFRLYTSMKVSDSLDKHLSLFYAELQRLKNILDATETGEKVFFILDEILRGTNALDRQAGAIATLTQLVQKEAMGVVATHDLELTKLEDKFPDKIQNSHFDGYVDGDKLLFDYILKPGKCDSFNALVLMRKIGIEI